MGGLVECLQEQIRHGRWRTYMTYMHTYQADLEKAEKDLLEDQKVRAPAGPGRVQTWECVSEGFVIDMRERDAGLVD
jgi:hypothetical protein